MRVYLLSPLQSSFRKESMILAIQPCVVKLTLLYNIGLARCRCHQYEDATAYFKQAMKVHTFEQLL